MMINVGIVEEQQRIIKSLNGEIGQLKETLEFKVKEVQDVKDICTGYREELSKAEERIRVLEHNYQCAKDSNRVLEHNYQCAKDSNNNRLNHPTPKDCWKAIKKVMKDHELYY